MSAKLSNGEEQSNMARRVWRSIRIDKDVEERLSARGKFGQSYNDVIAAILDELDGRVQPPKNRRRH